MALFQVSILNSDNEPDVVSDGSNITSIDHTGYDTNTEDGHEQSMFDFKKLIFVNPDATTYTFSTEGDGDELIASPKDSILPITTNYAYSTGDGVYYVKLMAVPTWQVDVVYNLTATHCVYYGGALYKALSNSIPVGTLPTNTTYWELITEENLPSKYYLCQAFAVYCDTRSCFLDSIKDAYCAIDSAYCGDDLCKNNYAMLSMKLWLLMEEIQILTDSNDYEKITEVINLAKNLCCCHE